MQKQPVDCRKRLAARRRGAAIVEGVVVTMATLVILLGALDLAVAVIRYNALSEGVRRVARAAIVHGEDAAPESTAWGPAPFTGAADSESEICAALRPALVGTKPADVTVEVTWLDGGNARGQRVQIAASHEFRPVLPFIMGADAIELRARSIMTIVH